MVKRIVHIFCLWVLLAGIAKGQAVFNLANNISDLNPERDALTITQGTMRITYTPNNGPPLDLSTAFTPITMRVIHRTDNYTNPVVGSFEISTNSTLIRWNFSFATPGSYRLMADVSFTDDTYPVFDRYLSVLATPSAAQVTANVNITNVISSTLIINANGTTVAEIVQP